MKIKLFSGNINTISKIETILEGYDLEIIDSLDNCADDESIFITDYDSVSKDINNVILNAMVPKYLIVLESIPLLATGIFLIKHLVKAYANTNMNSVQFKDMINAVSENKVWIYPELAAHFATIGEEKELDPAIMQRLADKEQEVVNLVMQGYTNEAISKQRDVSIRAVKSCLSSIFTKLHVNNRIGLILLLKS